MTHVLKAASPQDFLALVPELAGYHPRRSLVLVAFSGSRSCGVLRFDLPCGTVAPDAFATTAVGVLCKLQTADAVVPIVYTDERFGRASALPHSALLAEVVERARRAGFLVRSALVLAADGWGSLLDSHHPEGGRSRREIRLRTRSGVTGRRIGAVDDDAVLPVVSGPVRERVAQALAQLDGSAALRGIVGAETDSPHAIVHYFESALRNFCAPTSPRRARTENTDDRSAEPARGLPDELAAQLISFLCSPTLRDAALIQWAFGASLGETVLVEGIRPLFEEVPRTSAAADLLWGEGPRPDPDRIAAATGLLAQLAARAPRSDRPPLLTMLAWLSWAIGRSTVAGKFIDLALEIDPGYVLADIVHGMLAAGHLPEWAFGS